MNKKTRRVTRKHRKTRQREKARVRARRAAVKKKA